MKKIILITTLLLIVLITAGCVEQDQSQFNSEGNYLKSDVMIKEWCEHNKGRDFVEGRCEYLD